MLQSISFLLPVIFSFSGLLMPAPEISQNRVQNIGATNLIPTDLVITTDENTSALEKKVRPWLLYFTNQYRKANGLDTLNYDECLLKAAGYHSTYLINESQANGQFKLVHQEEVNSKWFKGKSASDRAAAAGCQKYCGENALFMTLPGITATEYTREQVLEETARKLARAMVFEQWHQSKPHRENMLAKTYSSMGVSVAIGKTSSSNSFPISDHQPTKLVAFGVQVFAF